MSKSSSINNQLELWVSQGKAVYTLPIDNEEIQLDESLRYLPNKRLTCRATWQERTVIAKVFFGRDFSKHMSKERHVLNALVEANIHTPRVLYSHQDEEKAVLLIDYLTDSIAVSDWLEDEPEEKSFENILSKMTALILECHNKGFELKDPHFDNFLIQGQAIYIIDAGNIIQHEVRLDDDASIQNMALLFAQLPVTFDVHAYSILTKTLTVLNSGLEIDEGQWRSLLIKQRRWRKTKFIDKKVFRNCTAYICQQDYSRFLVAKREIYTEEFEQSLKDPDGLIEQGTLLKNGNTATVALVEIAGKQFVLKRYNIKKPIHALLRGFMWSRAAVSWKNGLLLEMLGIPTATSYAVIEERWGAIRRRSYLLSEYIEAPQGWDIYEDIRFSEQDKVYWSQQITELFKLLERSQISHGDLKAQNILCAEKGALFIDLDGLRANQSIDAFNRQFRKDVARFHRSWPEKWNRNPYFSIGT